MAVVDDDLKLKLGCLLRRLGLQRAPRQVLACMGVGLALLAGFAVWRFWPAGDTLPAGDEGSFQVEVQASGAEEQVIAVDVEGEVRHPGLYSLPAGSRAGDAVEAAGGLTKHARTGAVNLAQLLEDGQQVTIPSKRDAQAATQDPAAGGGDQTGPVNINSASAQELQQLSGIGELLSQRIVDYRSGHGPFASVDELTEVPGIGEARLENLRAQICV
ncbi:MAG: helix-hairpin-helix domain-containing protein [Coriobacteriales bacterium]